MLAVRLSANVEIERIHLRLFERGFVVGMSLPNRVLRFYPLLIIEKRMIDSLVEAFQVVLV